MVLRTAVLCLLALGLSVGISLAKNPEIKLKIQGVKGRIEPGGTGSVIVTLKNRTSETREIAVALLYRDIADSDPFEMATITVPPKGKTTREFEVPVPKDWFDRRIRVVAFTKDAKANAQIRTYRAEFTDELWLRGEALYQEECGPRCHGNTGGKVKRDSLSSWTRAMRNGPKDMPRYRDLTRTDIVLMRQYAKDGKRVIE